MEGPHRNVFFRHLLPRRGPSCVASRRAARCSLVYRAASFRRGRRRPQTPGRRWAAVLPTSCVVVVRGAARPRDDGSPRLCRRVAGVAGRFGRVAPKPVVCNARMEARRDSGQRRRYRGAPTLATLRRPRAPGPTLRMALSSSPISLDRIDTLAALARGVNASKTPGGLGSSELRTESRV